MEWYEPKGWLSTLFLFALVFAVMSSIAQDVPPIKREEWKANPSVHTIPSEYAKEPAVVLSDNRRVEYIDVNDEQVEYKTLHKLVHINDDRGIEAYNKIYLPVAENKSIVDIRARTILAGGKVIELSKDDIKEIKEDDRIYKIFALEGLEKGCEIEFMYTYNTNLSYFGREIFQGNFNVLHCSLEILSPERLVFETMSFNGMNESTDTTLNGKKIVRLEQENVPGLHEEKYSMYTANLKRVEYKLSYNTARSATERIFTWNALAKNIFNINCDLSEGEQKKLSRFVDDRGWRKLPDEKQKIATVENYLKKNFAAREDVSSSEAINLEWIIKNKMCSYRGMMRLISAVYSELGINYEFVICGSRENFTVDRNFENYINCDNELLYFPSLRKYIAPTAAESRFPWINPEWGASNGIFCKKTTIGNYTSAIAYLKKIELEPSELTQSNIEAKISLNPGLDTAVVDTKQIHTGYFCTYLRSAFNYNSDEDQKLIIKSMIKRTFGTEKIVSSSIENQAFESYFDNKPFVINAKVEAPKLVERAGNKILLKIGEVIGSQVEMYQEKKRLLPIELAFGHVLDRKITFEIPAGYRVRNADDLVFNTEFKDDGEVTMGFVSQMKVTGNLLEVHVHEQYRNTYYPIEQYDPFMKIINAAADFNKVVLVLEKI
jgi:hypothetical protein